ncbi:hypothetical protein BHM03_00015783 [Ensete ventricosum]|nr:hypothetical protein BHM03_00015783 [Ensete ventricosum]
MHPLRFPNSGIRTKVFVRKINFKLHVMRLYRVESFYAFLLRFRSEERRPAMANPHAGPARPRPRPAHKGRSPVGAVPVGMAVYGQPARAASTTTPAKGQAAAWLAHVATASVQRASGGGVEGGKERARASFCEKDDPTPLNFENFMDCPHV